MYENCGTQGLPPCVVTEPDYKETALSCEGHIK